MEDGPINYRTAWLELVEKFAQKNAPANSEAFFIQFDRADVVFRVFFRVFRAVRGSLSREPRSTRNTRNEHGKKRRERSKTIALFFYPSTTAAFESADSM